MRQVFYSALALTIFATGAIFIKVQTVNHRSNDIEVSQRLTNVDTVIPNPIKDSAITYSIPENVNLGDPFIILLKVDPSMIMQQLEKSQILKVDLMVDEEEFRLVNLSPSEQALFSNEPNIWQWELTAISPGKNHLTISLTALVQVDGHSTNHFITSYSNDIHVTATTEQQIKSLYDRHKDKLWGFLIVPAFEWARRKYNKWREDKKSEQSHDA